ncbi:regulator of G-protein signaling protein-like [Passer montanus]|uniref:regulator of G-protein signaling protein-like n=1 Tax=Passer montanus TaxID=9160 RepID=UPI001961C58D|nr:regulator of G-protein signaling protein-like [Passer montanus]
MSPELSLLCHPSPSTFHTLPQLQILPLHEHRTSFYHTSPKPDFPPKTPPLAHSWQHKAQVTFSSPPVASIASTDMGLLLQDDVFVDFFNIFLNLPVFGQTPLYISGTGRWCLWPELPSHLDASPAALLAWLEKQRLPHFCKSSLCLHLVLCQRLLAFIRSGEAAELLNWQSADQWLLERCISGSQGMQHFCAFLRGTAGEELIDFWLITERLLGLDESDESQRELFLSLVHRLRATHLREGSSVITFCTTIVGSLPKAKHIQSISTRREILSEMQEQVLFMIQSYWLPKFFVHCKMGMEEEESCWPLLQEYQERLSRAGWQQPPGPSEPLPTMHIKRSQGVPGPYCSQKAKAEVWALVKEGRDTQELKMATFRVKSAGSREELCLDKDALGSIPQQSQHSAFGGRGGAAFPGRPQSSAEQDVENVCQEKILSDLLPSASLVRLPSLKKPVKTLDFLSWALSAEACAGRPFRDFLQHQNRPMETHLLDLWQDLEEFLPVVLDSNRENNFFLRHLIGEKICKTYLEDSSIEKLPLESRTLVSLWNHLICGEFSPWIFRTQKEICEVLCGLYEEFLAADDRTFLQFMAPGMDVPTAEVPGRAAGRWGHFHLSQRMNQSLQLSQALQGTRSLGGVSSKHWQLLAAQDLQKGGSIQAEMELLLGSAEFQRMIADELAVGSPSKEEELLQLMSAALGESRQEARWAPRHPSPLGSFCRRKGLSTPHRLCSGALTQPGRVAVGDFSEADAEEVKPWEEKQTEKQKKTEKKKKTEKQKKTEKKKKQKQKRKEQQQQEDLLPWSKKPRSRRPQLVKEGPEDLKTPRMGWAWDAIRELVRSFCKFQRDMKNHTRRAEFEEFLRQERRNKRENLPVKEKKSKSPAKSPRKDKGKGKGKGKGQVQKVTLVKRRILDKQLIVVSFLVDDLRFYLEMDKFSRLADCLEATPPCNMQSEKHSSFLKKKLDVISKVFLNSDIPPKLRVNISEKERDLIWRSSSKGPLTRAIYHNAKVTLFPILMYFWRRFCTWKVMRSFRAYQQVMSSSTHQEEQSFQLTKEDRSSRVQQERSSQQPKGTRSSQIQQERSSQEPKGSRRSQVQQQERSSQEPKGSRRSQVQQQERSSQEPKGGRSSRGRKEGRVPASSPPAKSPSKAPKTSGPTKMVAIPSTTHYSPGKKAVLTYTLSEGLEFLLPRPPKKTEPPEEKKAADPSGEKRPSLSEPAPQAGT